MNDPRAEYSRRIEFWDGEIARADRLHAVVANARLAAAAAVAVLAWQAFVSHRLSGWWAAPFVLGFVVLAAVHARIIDRSGRARRAHQLYERGTARLEAAWAGTGPDGARFLDNHAYARDLDLFGPASLFQLLDTARTQAGEDTLAAWLRAGAGIAEVKRRQSAVAELAPNVQLREDLAVIAADSLVGRTTALQQWAASPPAGLSAVHGIVFGACAIVAASLAVLVAMARVDLMTLVVWIAVQSAIARIWRRRVTAALAGIDVADHDLGLLSGLLARVEGERFTSPKLADLQTAITAAGDPPSRRIAVLRRLVTWLDHSTLNLWFRPIGALLLVRGQMAVAIDRWHANDGPRVAAWIGCLGEIEALSALGTYAFEHPADPFPELVERGPVFRSVALGHPLLPHAAAVTNDVALGDSAPRVLIVSGSNMSGKSTLLRAVGVNVVLALAGAPVRAASITMSPLVPGTAIQIDDSLAAGQSRFYAEILRIRDIVELARGSRPVVFLLDEILAGTNSHDRRIGAEAIVRSLVDADAIGLVTTHDLALTEFASSFGGRAANVHFADRIENGKMLFDYRMRAGVVDRSNALALMRAVGLDL